MTADSVFGMALRTGNWGPQAYMLSFHAKVTVQLAPAERPDVLVRLLDGLPAVPRELTKDDVVTLSVRDPSGGARLALDLRRGLVERSREPVTDGTWELRIEGTDQRSLHLYAQPGTRFPTDAELDALAATVEAPARWGGPDLASLVDRTAFVVDQPRPIAWSASTMRWSSAG